MDRESIYHCIDLERERQEVLHPKPNIPKDENDQVKAIAHYLWLTEMLSVMIEEVGEVGRALLGDGDLKEELIHVSAVCVRWLESLK
jgi:NTP pyrophosphatase (non-canonical NTP hydrolase)